MINKTVRGFFVNMYALLDMQKFQELHSVTKIDICVLAFVLLTQKSVYSNNNLKIC